MFVCPSLGIDLAGSFEPTPTLVLLCRFCDSVAVNRSQRFQAQRNRVQVVVPVVVGVARERELIATLIRE